MGQDNGCCDLATYPAVDIGRANRRATFAFGQRAINGPCGPAACRACAASGWAARLSNRDQRVMIQSNVAPVAVIELTGREPRLQRIVLDRKTVTG